jgi:uncharacterized membrane protein YjdF
MNCSNGVSRSCSPRQQAKAYNGQQGDIWDPHKDIGMAILAAIAAMTVYLVRARRDRE